MDGFETETLYGLLHTYETAIAELTAMADRAVEGLIARLTKHQTEVLVALESR